MRKIIVCSLLVIFALTMTCFAQMISSIQVYNVNLRNNTGDAVTVQIPITTIIPKVHKIIEVDCIPIQPAATSHTECFVSLFDTTSTDLSGECLGEFEKDGGFSKEFSLRPRKVINQVTARQSAYTDVQIIFIKE